TRTLPLGQVETFTYDDNGNVLTRTDFNGNTTTHTYDVLNRLTKKTFSDNSETPSPTPLPAKLPRRQTTEGLLALATTVLTA
ncbi:MAG: RHS repeat protein, partial [Deltaproteobacteria bacterium]|nr:RHS repeat protein [Deltaproteobacteria bacterium]